MSERYSGYRLLQRINRSGGSIRRRIDQPVARIGLDKLAMRAIRLTMINFVDIKRASYGERARIYRRPRIIFVSHPDRPHRTRKQRPFCGDFFCISLRLVRHKRISIHVAEGTRRIRPTHGAVNTSRMDEEIAVYVLL